MVALTPANSFAALRALDVAHSSKGMSVESAIHDLSSHSDEFVLVDDHILMDDPGARSVLERMLPQICVPEVVLDIVDNRDKTEKRRDERQSVLVLQEKMGIYYFQSVKEYDMDFIKTHQIQGHKLDHLLILAAARYFQEHLKEIGFNKVVVLSSSKAIMEFNKKHSTNFEIYGTVDEYRKARKGQ